MTTRSGSRRHHQRRRLSSERVRYVGYTGRLAYGAETTTSVQYRFGLLHPRPAREPTGPLDLGPILSDDPGRRLRGASRARQGGGHNSRERRDATSTPDPVRLLASFMGALGVTRRHGALEPIPAARSAGAFRGRMGRRMRGSRRAGQIHGGTSAGACSCPRADAEVPVGLCDGQASRCSVRDWCDAGVRAATDPRGKRQRSALPQLGLRAGGHSRETAGPSLAASGAAAKNSSTGIWTGLSRCRRPVSVVGARSTSTRCSR